MTAALAMTGQTASQATKIEQARATAEVLAAVEAAKRWERIEDKCKERMERACKRPQVYDRAFWAFPRSGERLTGPTIHLAVTLAGIWGNIDYGVMELERSERHSEMLAVAWDLETNARAKTSFIVPHYMDTKNGRKTLTDLRDVYENNANLGARRVREMIFRVLPDWYTETAQDICRAMIERPDVPIEEQRAEVGRELAALGVTREQVTAKVGREWAETMPGDLAILRIIAKSIRRGETTIREQFEPEPPVQTVSTAAPTVAELIGTKAPAPEPTIDIPIAEPVDAPTNDADPPAEQPPVDDKGEPERPAQRGPEPPKGRMKRLFALLAEAGIGDDDRHGYASGVLQRDIPSFTALDASDVEALISNLEEIAAPADGSDD